MKKNQHPSIDENPDPIINLALGYQASQVLFAAINLDLFTILERGAKGISDIAAQVESDEGALSRLLDTLVSFNLLEEKKGFFCNAKRSSQYLVKGKKNYLGNAIHHGMNLWDFWKQLDEQIKHGKGRGPKDEQLRDYPHRLRDYLYAMDDFAEFKAERISNLLSIKKYSNMLDVGCGQGTYPLTFASQNNNLRCTLLDLEPTIAYTRERIQRSRFKNRMSIQPCQILEDEIPGDEYDLIFMSNLIHAYGESDVQTILEKAWAKAATNADIVIHDYILHNSRHGPRKASLFDLTMFVGTPRGRCYTMDDIKRLLGRLGVSDVKKIPVRLGSSLVIGMKSY